MTASGLAHELDDASDPLLGVRRSARGFTWVERLSDQRVPIAAAIAQRLGVPDLLGRVLAARGADIASVGTWLEPTLRDLMPDPSKLCDMDKGAERLARAIETGEHVAIFGDYDVDGASSSALVASFVEAHGRKARIYIPDRLSEGYGPNSQAFATLADEGATLIVTVDCGTTSFSPIAEIVERGIDVVVVDHHMADERLPDAHAVINPNRLDDLSGQGDLAAAGVTFLLLVATARHLRQSGWYEKNGPQPDLRRWLDLVALATIADVVPLGGLNRAFVATGLKVLHARQNPGLRALADVAGLTSEPTAYHLGFVLGPRINAGGRIGNASLGARLLTAQDDLEARGIADELEKLNRARKAIEAEMIEEAMAAADHRIEDNPDAPVVLVESDTWHKGLVGLIASRLVERYQRPALAITWDQGTRGTGSARSIAGADIGSAVRAAMESGLLVKGGGHAMAAGLTVEKSRFEELRNALADSLQSDVLAARALPTLEIDGMMSGGGATRDLMELLDKAGPFGSGNPEPRFVFAGHRCGFSKIVGNGHVRCQLSGADGVRLDAIAFRCADTELGRLLLDRSRDRLHVVGNLRRSTWGGREKVELIVEDAADPQKSSD